MEKKKKVWKRNKHRKKKKFDKENKKKDHKKFNKKKKEEFKKLKRERKDKKFKKEKRNKKLKKDEQKGQEVKFLKREDTEKKETKFLEKKEHFEKKEGILETYEIEVDKAKIQIEIKKEKGEITYILYLPVIPIATTVFLEEIKNELIAATSVGMSEILDPAAFTSIKKRFMTEAEKLLKQKLPTVNDSLKDILVSKLMQDMMGLGEIEFLVNDPHLEEIVIPSSKEPIRVYHKKYGWVKTNFLIRREDEISNYSNIIARRVGRQITVLTPLLDAHLVSGDRVNSILYPISTKGNTITIRKFARDPFTIIDMINNKTCSVEIAALIWLAIEYEMNVLISGGTASGKTAFLNACMPFIPPNHRIISVEDTRELMLPGFLYWTPLVTRNPNPEGKGEVSMLDLLINCLRMRPDRIVLGEMRRKAEARVLFEAMHTGHSVYATVHADSAAETISRLTNPPLDIPANLLRAVNLNIVMFRDRRKGIRRIFQMAEFDSDDQGASANVLYRWVAEQDKIVKHSENSKFFETISRTTGMSNEEMEKDLEFKREVLLWLIKNKLRGLEQIGKVVKVYYTNKSELMRIMSKNDLKHLFGDSDKQGSHKA